MYLPATARPVAALPRTQATGIPRENGELREEAQKNGAGEAEQVPALLPHVVWEEAVFVRRIEPAQLKQATVSTEPKPRSEPS